MSERFTSTCGPYVIAGAAVIGGLLFCQTAGVCNSGSGDGVSAEKTSWKPVEWGPPDQVLVTVNGTDITRADVNEEIEAVVIGPDGYVPEDVLQSARAELTPQIKEMLITRTLLQQAADAEDVSVSEAEIEEVIEEISSRLPPDTSLDEIRTGLGISDEQWRAQLMRELRINKLLESRVTGLAVPTNEEIEAFYTDVVAANSAPDTVSLDEVRDDIATELQSRKQREAVESYIGELKGNASIVHPETGEPA